ncbi:copper oxidase [Streptomyces radicis]|uniref:Copper oxidase n=1 Tax=Streptomyces radicis TaxID=1750517 RepID=A0A3A9WF08_9ACTN|nr:copper oxidase [Streptomyces radicis]RKN26829.1 copper oxidase [Streptomyces radicis]
MAAPVPPVATRRAAARGATPLPSVVDPQYLSPIADAQAIPYFVNALPRPSRIEMLDGGRRRMVIGQTAQDMIGGELGLLTKVWGYGQKGHRGRGGLPITSPGPTFVARSHHPLEVEWANDLPYAHLLPVDDTIHWAFSGSEHTIERNGVPTVVHLHGSRSRPESDGHPDAWYTPTGVGGPRYAGNRFSYPNLRGAGTLWYHDHTHGITRLNIYAGLTGFYLLRDDAELALIAEGQLPAEPYEVEMILQDRTFRPDGQLAYPDPTWQLGGASGHPEYFGDVICVNGKAWPYLEVEPRRYRFRLLNGSNSRIYRLAFDGRWPIPFSVIGADGGFLEIPAPLERPLLLSPGERVDLIADFSGAEGGTFDLTNSAGTPFPYGDPVTEPASRVIQFRVNQPLNAAVPDMAPPGALRDAPYTIRADPARTRRLLLVDLAQLDVEHGTLTEDGGHGATMRLGTVEQGGLSWSDPVTEDPGLNDTEIWEFYNSTLDTHTVHLHLVQFQVLDETPYIADTDAHTGALSDIHLGEPLAPDLSELGPKDTVRVRPGHVVRVKATFDEPGDYVWHCHLLEHEDHAMMRPFRVS